MHLNFLAINTYLRTGSSYIECSVDLMMTFFPSQVVSWVSAVPAFAEKCVQLGTKDLKFLLQHCPNRRHFNLG